MLRSGFGLVVDVDEGGTLGSRRLRVEGRSKVGSDECIFEWMGFVVVRCSLSYHLYRATLTLGIFDVC